MTAFNVDLDTPFEQLTEDEKTLIFYGSGTRSSILNHEGDFGLRDLDMAFGDCT
jgi:excinuclease ABC subunit A